MDVIWLVCFSSASTVSVTGGGEIFSGYKLGRLFLGGFEGLLDEWECLVRFFITLMKNKMPVGGRSR